MRAGGDAATAPALDPRPDPAGRRLAYVCDGRAAGQPAWRGDRPGPGRSRTRAARRGVTFGLAEFIAAEEMDRHRGYWWAPDGSALLVARVDETPVNRWHIADPAHPERAPAEVAYPAAGTANADVTLLLARLDGQPWRSRPDRGRFPYLVTAAGRTGTTRWSWCRAGTSEPMRILGVDPAAARPRVLHEDTDPVWLEIVPGVPGLDRGRPDRVDPATSRTPAAWCCWRRAGGRARSPRPACRSAACSTWTATRCCSRRPHEPAEIGLWSYGPGGLSQVGPGRRRRGGRPARGGTTVSWPPGAGRRRRDASACTARRRGRRCIASLAERPALPAPRPVLFRRRAARDPDRRAVPVLAPARAGPAAGAARPVRRPARAAGARGPRRPTWSRSGSPSRASRW